MASPQIEHGYTRIANELLEAIYNTKFNGTQFKIILCIIRYTYGFKRKSHDLSIGFISKATGVSRRYVSAELSKLIENKVVSVLQPHTDTTSRVLAINKDYSQWNISRTIIQQVNNSSTGEQIQDTTGEELFNTPDEQLFHQERKYLKKEYKENIYRAVYEHYLSLNLVKHKKFTPSMEQAIKTAMKNNGYTIDDCKQLLDRHKQMVEQTKDSQYPVRPRPLHEFFGQKAYQAKHLICADYEEGGKYYNATPKREEPQPSYFKPLEYKYED